MRIIPYTPVKAGTPFQKVSTTQFNGGLQLTRPAISLQADEFQTLNDMYINDEGLLEARSGYEPIHDYAESETQQTKTFIRTDIATNGYVRAVDYIAGDAIVLQKSAGGAFSNIHTFTTRDKPRYLEYNTNAASDLLIFNGSETPLRWNETDGAIELGLEPPPDSDTEWTYDATPEGWQFSVTLSASPTTFTTGNPHNLKIADNITFVGVDDAGWNASHAIATVPTDYTFTIARESTGDDFSAATWTADAEAFILTSEALATDAPALGSGGITDACTAYYRFTHFYSNGTKFGESNGTGTGATETYSVAVTATHQVKIDVTAFPSQVAYTTIYRSINDRNGPYYYIGKAYYNLTGTSIDDRTGRGAEGDTLPIDDGEVANIKYAITSNGRVVAADGDYPKKLVWTEPGYPDLYPALNYFYFQEEITGLVNYKREIYIFTENAVYVIPGSDIANQKPLKVSDKGCVSADSVVDVNLGVCWLSQDGVYFSNFNIQAEDGDLGIPIGQPIRTVTDTINADYANKAIAVFNDNKYIISLPSDRKEEAYEVFCWNVIPGLKQLQQGRYGGWTRVSWQATWMFSKETLYHAPGSLLNGKTWTYKHNADPASGTVYDYPTNVDGDKETVGCKIKTGMYTPEAEINEGVLIRSSVVARTTGTVLSVQADFNADEFREEISLDLGSGSAESEADAAGWMIWDVSDWVNIATITSASSDGSEITYLATETGSIEVGDIMLAEGFTAGWNGTGTVQAIVNDTSVTLNIVVGAGAAPDGAGTLTETTPTWAAQSSETQQVSSKRWPRGSKANTIEITYSTSDIGQTTFYDFTHYIKELPRAI